MRRIVSLLMCLALCMSFGGCKEDSSQETKGSAAEQIRETTASNANELVLLYTNDVKNAYLREENEGRLGYAAVAAYRDAMEDAGKTVVLLDGGDALTGEVIGLVSKGSQMVDMMNETGCAFAVPGDRDLALGVDTLKKYAEKADFQYICCNLLDTVTGELVFPAYAIEAYEDVSIAFVGITTPVTDPGGGCGFETEAEKLYERVQDAIDRAKQEGAAYVIAIGHTGIDPADDPYTTAQIIANTTGLTAYLDAHSNSWVSGETFRDMDDKKVAVFANPEKLTSFACVTLDLNTGAVSGELIREYGEDAASVVTAAEEVTDDLEDWREKVAVRCEAELSLEGTGSGETALGSFCADAYREITGADAAILNAGDLFAGLSKGAVTYGDLEAVQPYGYEVCVMEATGQQLLDALEFACSQMENGDSDSFLQVSGITFRVDLSVPTPVTLDKESAPESINGQRRVSDVKIGGEDIILWKTYRVASHSSLLCWGSDGYTAFQNRNVTDLEMLDCQVLIRYAEDVLGGVIRENVYGQTQQRIVLADTQETAE